MTAHEPGTVIMALDESPRNLDPRIGTDAASERLIQLMFSSLVKRSFSYDIEPDLALSWEIPIRRPTFSIFEPTQRSTMAAHSLHAMSCSRFAACSAERFRLRKPGRIVWCNPSKLRTTYTVVFKLKEPFAPFLWNLTRGAIGIIPDGSPADFAKNPVGSGAYKFVRYAPDSEVVLERNENYYGKKPNLSRFVFKIIPETIVRALELRKGSVDIALDVLTPDMVEALRGNKDLEVMLGPGTNYQYVAFNLKDPLFSDIRVRKAIAHAIDRDKIINYLWRGQAKAATGVIPPNNWSYAGDVAKYAYDPELARKLLRDAGHDHLSFTYRTATDDTGRLLAAVLQQQLRDVGIEMNIRSNEFATFYSDVIKGNFQLYSLRWIGGNNDPDILNFVFHSMMYPPNGANRGRYANTEVDRLIDFARREVNTEKRKDAYQTIQRIVADELPYVSLFYVDNVAVFNKRIEGIKLFRPGSFSVPGPYTRWLGGPPNPILPQISKSHSRPYSPPAPHATKFPTSLQPNHRCSRHPPEPPYQDRASLFYPKSTLT
jgi:peptide/nickel transport system substrate-binding protein